MFPKRVSSAMGAALMAAGMTSAQPVVTPVGQIGGFYSYVGGISGYGWSIASSYRTASNDMHACRWTPATGVQDLGTLGGVHPQGFVLTYGLAISGSGDVITGQSLILGGKPRAFRWTSRGGMESLGTLGDDSRGLAVSADGGTIAGDYYASTTIDFLAFRWTASTGMQPLGTLGGARSTVRGLSADGKVIAGWSLVAGPGTERAFRWSESAGMQSLGTLGGSESYASAISADGAVVAGQASVEDGAYHAFRWTTIGGMQDLGTLGGSGSYAASINGPGTIIVGSATTAGFATRAFIWSPSLGMVDLNDYLPTLGVDLSDWTLFEARVISRDGTAILASAGYRGNSTWEDVLITGVPLPCEADVDADGFVTFGDFDAFVTAMEMGDASSDFNNDGFLTFEDFDAFVAAFEAGC